MKLKGLSKKVLSLVLAGSMAISIIPFMGTTIDVYAATGSEIVAEAEKYKGQLSYVYGGKSLTDGADCSGFVIAILNSLNMGLGDSIASAYDMYNNASTIGTNLGTDKSLIQNGDLVIFNSGDHVGFGAINPVNGSIEIVHQSNPTRGVVRDALSWLTSGSNGMSISAIIRLGESSNNNTDNNNSDNTDNQNESDNKDNPGAPYAIPTSDVSTASEHGDAAKWVQQALNTLENAGLDVDGAFGTLSETAVKNFQKKFSLTENGIADTATITKMVDVYKALNNVKSIKIEGGNKTYTEGDVGEVNIIVEPSEYKDLIKNSLYWATANADIAYVKDGVVTAKSSGTVTMTVKALNGVSDSVAVTIVAKPRYSEWYKGLWYSADGTQTWVAKGEWKTNYAGKWYEDETGFYPQSEWQKIDEKWYYFDSNGYVVKGWKVINGTYYYFDKDGVMAENEWYDNWYLNEGGAWVWPYEGAWKHNDTGWWYEDYSGWYPSNETVKIDGVSYEFNENGYWIEN